MKKTTSVCSNTINPWNDECDCDQRCPKCGKKKRGYQYFVGPVMPGTTNYTVTSVTATGGKTYGNKKNR